MLDVVRKGLTPYSRGIKLLLLELFLYLSRIRLLNGLLKLSIEFLQPLTKLQVDLLKLVQFHTTTTHDIFD